MASLVRKQSDLNINSRKPEAVLVQILIEKSQYFRIIRRYWDSCFTVYFILATVESRGNLLEVGTCLRRPLEPQQMV